MIAETILEQTRALWENDELPPDLAWIENLLPRHQRLFYAELQYQWGRYCATQDGAPLLAFLEDWQATSEVDRNPELSAELLKARKKGEFEEWKAAS